MNNFETWYVSEYPTADSTRFKDAKEIARKAWEAGYQEATVTAVELQFKSSNDSANEKHF